MGAKGVKLREYRRLQLLRIDIIASLYKRGYTYREIRKEVMTRLDLKTYSLETVNRDIAKMLKEWRQERMANLDDAVPAEIERLRTMQREAWEAWDKSRLDYDKQWARQIGVPNPEGEGDQSGDVITVKMEQSKENMVNCGDPRYLEIIFKCGTEIRKLLGLYAPEKKEVTGKDGKDLIQNIQVEIIDRREQVDTDEGTDD